MAWNPVEQWRLSRNPPSQELTYVESSANTKQRGGSNSLVMFRVPCNKKTELALAKAQAKAQKAVLESNRDQAQIIVAQVPHIL